MQAVRSILIPDGEDELALRVLRCLAEVPDFKVSVLSRDRRAPIRFSRHLHRFLTHGIDGFNQERIEVIKEAAVHVGADIILPTGLPGIRLVAEYKEELTSVARIPPLASAELLGAFADKLSLAEILEREGVAYPKILRSQGALIDEDQITGIPFPALVKPRKLEAGNGIRLCETPRQVVEYLRNQRDPSNFFLQEFISGLDIGCSILSDDGEILAYTVQREIARSHKPFHPPAAVEFVHEKGVFDTIEKLVRSVKWSGIVNFDLVIDRSTGQPKVLEANPRYWRSLLGSLTAGVNFPYIACLASEGRTISTPEYDEVRYAKPELALSFMLKRWLGRASELPDIPIGSLKYILRDPLPDMSIQLARVHDRFLGPQLDRYLT